MLASRQQGQRASQSKWRKTTDGEGHHTYTHCSQCTLLWPTCRYGIVCSIQSLVYTMRYHLTLVRMAIIKKSMSMGFSRQEYWSGLPFPTPGDLPDPGIEPKSPVSPELQVDSLLLGSPIANYWRRGKLGNWNWHIHTTIYKIDN